MQYKVTSPQSKVERIEETDSPQRAAARYVYRVWGTGEKRRTVHVQIGTTTLVYELILHPSDVVLSMAR